MVFLPWGHSLQLYFSPTLGNQVAVAGQFRASMGDRAGGSGPGFYLSVHLDSKRTTEHQTAMDPKQSNRVNCQGLSLGHGASLRQ
jgi:hypothetical protein